MNGDERQSWARRYCASMARALGCIAACTAIIAAVFGTLAPLAGAAAAALVIVTLTVICNRAITRQWHGSAALMLGGYRRVYAEGPLRRITRRPLSNASAIAAMEREIYGETFGHAGGEEQQQARVRAIARREGLDAGAFETLIREFRAKGEASVRVTCEQGHGDQIWAEGRGQMCPQCDEYRPHNIRWTTPGEPQ